MAVCSFLKNECNKGPVHQNFDVRDGGMLDPQERVQQRTACDEVHGPDAETQENVGSSGRRLQESQPEARCVQVDTLAPYCPSSTSFCR